ncbi:MAG: ABC transporter substrate-binding protein [Clostridia bacterium]|nr:ABC transporter substrate-binding protein [Clostridia bacterium]
MFKKISLVLFLIISLILAGCGGQSSQTSGGAPEATDNGEVKKIGILQLVEHPALDAAREGFLDGLKANGWEEGKNITVQYQNAQNDQSNLKAMSNKLVNEKMDLILAIATPSAISLANETQEIPILITAVTDPVAANLVESMEKPNTNITGTTDMNPIEQQLKLALEIVPNIKTLGVIYNAGEINSQVQVEILKEKGKALGIENFVEATVANAGEVMQGAQSLVGRVDAIYIPTDNTVMSAYGAVVQVAEENKVPLFTGEATALETGGIGTVGIDYYNLGKQTADMADKVLKGSNPAEMPIEEQKDPQLIINKAGAERLGVTIPESFLNKADQVIE